MYSSAPGTGVIGGGITAGTLAHTGSGSILAPMIIAAVAMVAGGLLLVRARLLTRQAEREL